MVLHMLRRLHRRRGVLRRAARLLRDVALPEGGHRRLPRGDGEGRRPPAGAVLRTLDLRQPRFRPCAFTLAGRRQRAARALRAEGGRSSTSRSPSRSRTPTARPRTSSSAHGSDDGDMIPLKGACAPSTSTRTAARWRRSRSSATADRSRRRGRAVPLEGLVDDDEAEAGVLVEARQRCRGGRDRLLRARFGAARGSLTARRYPRRGFLAVANGRTGTDTAPAGTARMAVRWRRWRRHADAGTHPGDHDATPGGRQEGRRNPTRARIRAEPERVHRASCWEKGPDNRRLLLCRPGSSGYMIVSYGDRNPYDRRPAAHGREGQDRAAGGDRARHQGSLLLLSPRARHRRILPRLPGEDREDAEAADGVLDAGRRGHGRHDRHARRRRGAGQRVRVPADQSPARLPRVRQGRRVPAAGLLLFVRARTRAGWSSRAACSTAKASRRTWISARR